MLSRLINAPWQHTGNSSIMIKNHSLEAWPKVNYTLGSCLHIDYYIIFALSGRITMLALLHAVPLKPPQKGSSYISQT